MVGDQQRGNPWIIHADTDPVPGDARLRSLEGRAADLVAIADAHLVVAESFHGEVLAELSVDEVVSSQFAFPMPVGVHLVNEHGTGSLKTPVKTVLPCHDTSFGRPTLTDSNVPTGWPSGWLESTDSACGA